MSSGSTQKMGKGGTRDRGNKTATASAQSAKSNAADGHAKTPDGFNPKIQPTAEQIRLAQIINDSSKADDPDIQKKVQQVMEVTGGSSDAVVIALHDSDNDPARAINLLLEGNQPESEWETTGKKKKQREVVPKGPEAMAGNKENRGRGDGPRSRGGPRSQGPPRNWKNKESEKNERNLEDGREGRPRGARRGRGGRGGERGGRGSRTFQNRGYGSDSTFPHAMDTWTNSAPESTQPSGDTMTVGNWNSDFTASEDWSEEDWTGQLETKVFTPSTHVAAAAATSQPPTDSGTVATGGSEQVSAVSIMELLKSGAEASAAAAAAAAAAPAPHQPPTAYSVAQYNQQATETIKAAVGMSTSTPYSLAAAGPTPMYNSVTSSSSETNMVSTVSKGGSPAAASLPPRSKPARVRVPPPSKIPESAVEMPDDAVTSLDVQFGGLEFGADTFDFAATSDSITTGSQQAPMSSSAFADAHAVSKSNASGNLPSLPASQTAPLSSSQAQMSSQTQGQMSQHVKESASSAPQGMSVLSGSRPPGIPAQGSSGRKETAAAVNSMIGQSTTPASSGQKVNSGMAADHMLLQSSQHIPDPKSTNVSASNKMYGGVQRSSQGLDGTTSLGGASAVGVKASVAEQPMYSSAGAHPYGGASSGVSYQGVPKGLGGGVCAPLAQNFAASVASSQHYYPQQPASAFAQQQSNGYQTPYQGNAYVPSAQASSYGVSSKLSGSLSGHPVKESVLDASQSSSVQHSYEGSHSSNSVTGVLQAGAMPALATTASSLAGATATTSVLKNSMSASKALPNMPPGVPAAAMLGHQYVMGNVPFYQPLYSYEDLQVLQSRFPTLGYYDMQFQVPTSITGRDLGLNNIAYADTKFSRGESSDSSPAGASQGGQQGGGSAQGSGQGTGPSHQQAYLNALHPGYGYYFPGGMMPGSIHPYGPPPPPPIFPVPPATNAHGPTSSGQFQKANAYSSHSFASGGYESLTQTPDYTKGAYGAGSQGQAKGMSGSLGSGSSADIPGSGYSKSHAHLAKSFEKPGFHAVTPPPAFAPFVSLLAPPQGLKGHASTSVVASTVSQTSRHSYPYWNGN
ncbi:protein lingerer-like isoform X2 [Ornithodoros turicata]|uniref:protein lingerer-like isoform X2 n=1 Tax=Ornithodoros turicata TaxID=34597 RepID=UPI00313965F0